MIGTKIKLLVLRILGAVINVFLDKPAKIPGSPLKIYLRKNDSTSARIFLNTFELKERQFVRNVASENTIFLDIGSNVGIYSLEACTKFRHVYSFDMIGDNLKLLEASAVFNNVKNISTINRAVGRESNKELNVCHHSESGLNYVYYENDAKDDQFSSGSKVSSISLDDFYDKLPSSHKGSTFFAKVDVEGFEGEVLSGAKLMLQNAIFSNILVELVESHLARNNKSIQQIISYLRCYGYVKQEYVTENSQLFQFPIHNNYLFRHVTLISG